MNKLQSLIKGLLDSKSSLSSKRAVGLGSFLLLAQIVQVMLYLYWKRQIEFPEYMVITITSLIVACLGLNTYLTTKSMSSKPKEEEENKEN